MHSRTVAQVLKHLMDRGNLSENALARVTDVNQPTIHRILKGESKDPKTSTLEPLARYFGVTIAQLRGEEPLPGESPFPSHGEHPARYRAKPSVVSDEPDLHEIVETYYVLNRAGKNALRACAKALASVQGDGRQNKRKQSRNPEPA